ncbi:MAG: arginase [Methylococcaceae bacterium]|nr:arginase [Methylococcaceae bacterium]
MIIQSIGISSCLGGPERHCGYAAEMLRNEYTRSKNGLFEIQWHMLHPDNKGSNDDQLIRLNQTISQHSAQCLKQGPPFLVVGGDHSCALGTWSGILNTLDKSKKLGLIWLDAHLDAHTFSTSPSGNIHGMPIAALLGCADKKLAKFYPTNHTVDAENLKLIGIRSYEEKEYQLLKQQHVNITFADQISNLTQLLSSTVSQLSHSCELIGISIDLDVVAPEDAPGVETPVDGGIRAKELIQAISAVRNKQKICALEISEFNPETDVNNKTLYLIKSLVDAFYPA